MGLFSRVKQFDIRKLTVDTSERAAELLKDLKLSDVQEISKAAGAFFAWVGKVL